MLLSLLLLLVYFVLLWLSAETVINTVERLARRFALSRFSLSLILLGPITSLPEMAVMLNSIILKTPQVPLGNLIGGQIFILFFIIPLLGLMVGSIKLPQSLQGRSLWVTLLMIGAPIITVADKQLVPIEGIILLALYSLFFVNMYREASFGDKIKARVHKAKNFSGISKDLVKIMIGIIIVFLVSNRIVVEVTKLAELMQLSRFFVSLLILSIGTNLPELSLSVLGALNGKKDLALGNFIGSAGVNSLLVGILVLFNRAPIILNGDVHLTLPIFLIGIVIFSIFAKSHKTLSRKECLALMSVYFISMGIEFYREFTD